MKVAVRYHSRTGNTKKVALAIAEALGVDAKDASVPLEEKVDILFLGSAVYAAGVDDAMKAFVAGNKDNISVRQRCSVLPTSRFRSWQRSMA